MAKPTLQAPVEVVPLFAVYREDKYESTYPLSHHKTKEGAYREMRRQIVEYWLDQWSWYVEDERTKVYNDAGARISKRQGRWNNPLHYVRFFVAPDNIKIYA
jgi:hypothetical protein